MHDESRTIKGVEILWDTARGTMESIGRPLAAFWLDPSLLNTLAPLRDEIGTELFRLLIADSSSHGTKEDYESMVTVFGATFEEGFLAWGRAVGIVGWGRFEISAIDRAQGTARVLVRSPWELVMQARLESPWGCPFLMGKMIGIFRHALGTNCWANERCFHENGEPVVELSLFRSPMTIEAELARLRTELARVRAKQMQAEVELRTALHRTSEQRMRAVLASMNSWVFTMDDDGLISSHYVPHRPEKAYFPERDTNGLLLSEVLPEDAARQLRSAAATVFRDGDPITVEYDLLTAEGNRHFAASLSPLRDTRSPRPSVTVVVHDTTEQRRAQEQNTLLEAQLHQAQKMEAIGQLTGGVAHDFNNLLTAIMGNLVLAKEDSTSPEVQLSIDEAMAAAQSAATLTRRLLAFSRRQPLQPHRVDPQALVSGMQVLLRRTLGERIDIALVGSAGQWFCEVDGAQLESAILNLAINARDAMVEGGKITIETSNVRISAEYAAAYEDLLPGQYVLVAVSDTGIGMSEEVQKKAFDPFFTTKGIGRGSGLGLSMVYGFARQSRGHVKIYSEPGVGTTVKLYLPRSTEETLSRAPAIWEGPAPAGDGSMILVVEDDTPVRHVSVRFLRSLGYRTQDCGTAEEAMDILRNDASIELLFTDVVLAGEMNGAQLGRAAQSLRPGLPVLFTSGYTENAIFHHGRLDVGVHLVEKPFTKEHLARRVHAALHETAG